MKLVLLYYECFVNITKNDGVAEGPSKFKKNVFEDLKK